MPKQISNELLTRPVELLRIAPPPECEKLSSADWDTLKRNHADKVVKISRRREGMRVGHALMLGSDNAA
jgi:hypothetical protein